MNRTTHILFSLFCSLLALDFLSYESFTFIVLALFASLLPDIDDYGSTYGKQIRPISFFLKHRGMFHSLIPILLILLLGTMMPSWATVALSIGYISHIILDAFTPSGVQVFWPFRLRIRGIIKTGSLLEWGLASLFLLGIIYQILLL